VSVFVRVTTDLFASNKQYPASKSSFFPVIFYQYRADKNQQGASF
jgi:hypothetical protein